MISSSSGPVNERRLIPSLPRRLAWIGSSGGRAGSETALGGSGRGRAALGAAAAGCEYALWR